MRFRRFPLFSSLDLTFLAPQSEYRPTEYMQIWMRAWLEDDARLLMAKILLLERIALVSQSWKKNFDLIQSGIYIDENALNTFKQDIDRPKINRNYLQPKDVGLKRYTNNLLKALELNLFVMKEKLSRHYCGYSQQLPRSWKLYCLWLCGSCFKWDGN